MRLFLILRDVELIINAGVAELGKCASLESYSAFANGVLRTSVEDAHAGSKPRKDILPKVLPTLGGSANATTDENPAAGAFFFSKL